MKTTILLLILAMLGAGARGISGMQDPSNKLKAPASQTVSFDYEAKYIEASNGILSQKIGANNSTNADFAYSRLTISPEVADAGNPINVTVTVRNTGNLSGSTTVTLVLNGIVKETKEATLDSGKDVALSFTLNTDNYDGNYNVKIGDQEGAFTVLLLPIPDKSLEYSGLQITPTKVSPGDNVTITINVRNKGSIAGLYNVILSVDGSVKSTRTGPLKGGNSTTVKFTLSSSNTGVHEIEVGTLGGSFNVTAPTPPQQTGTREYILYTLVGVEAVIILLVILLFLRRRRSQQSTT
jgi:LPXTG-motif cell wall-anchored protein